MKTNRIRKMRPNALPATPAPIPPCQEIIEVNAPMRFCWGERPDGSTTLAYDGSNYQDFSLEIGPFGEVSAHQRRLLRRVMSTMRYILGCANVVGYLVQHDKAQLDYIVTRMGDKSTNIPTAFLNAFADSPTAVGDSGQGNDNCDGAGI